MQVRVWSRKIVAVLKYFLQHPHSILFGITGDIDNLGVYVARNGRAQAEILVDTYNRLIGSMFYDFLDAKPHDFFETCFLPAGEEIFILGTAAYKESAEALFSRLHSAKAPQMLDENVPFSVGETDITFGCSVFESDFLSTLISSLIAAVENADVISANSLYIDILIEIRLKLSTELDKRKFASLQILEGDEVLMRNLVYLKTLQYKQQTKDLLLQIQRKLNESQESRMAIYSILGSAPGLQQLNAQEALSKILKIL